MAPSRHHVREATGDLGKTRSWGSSSTSTDRRTGIPLLRSWRGDQVSWFPWSSVFCVCSPTSLYFIFLLRKLKNFPNHKDFVHVLILCLGSHVFLLIQLWITLIYLYGHIFRFTVNFVHILLDWGWKLTCWILCAIWGQKILYHSFVLFVCWRNSFSKHMLLSEQIKKPTHPKWFEHESCVI